MVIRGVTVAVVVYLLDKRRAKREQQLSDYRIASNWFQTQPRVSLRCFDLTYRNLSSYKFVDANMEETIFTQSKMWNTGFSMANLRLTKFLRTEIVGCKFNKAVVIRGDFSNSTIRSRQESDYTYIPDFSEANLKNVKFIGSHIDGAIFNGATLENSDFGRAAVLNCNFTGADLANSNWRKVRRVENCIWNGVKIDNRANFPGYLWKEIQKQNTESNVNEAA